MLLGLLTLQEGQILCDGVDVLANKASWLAQIGYISQTVYMLDDTIRANVAFGVPADKIREERVREVLVSACPGDKDKESELQGLYIIIRNFWFLTRQPPLWTRIRKAQLWRRSTVLKGRKP